MADYIADGMAASYQQQQITDYIADGMAASYQQQQINGDYPT